MSDEHDILIDNGGSVRFVYSDTLAEVFDGEQQHTVRASHVEFDNLLGGWTADMRPSGGPILPDHDTGATFKTRQEALDAERQWLREHKGL